MRRDIAPAGGDLECVADRVDDEVGITHRGQFNDPGATAVVGLGFSSSLECQPSLAGTPHTGRGEKAMVRKSLDDVVQFLFTADERRQLHRQVVRMIRDRRQRRKGVVQRKDASPGTTVPVRRGL